MNVVYMYKNGSIQLIFSQKCQCWWAGALAPGHQQQCCVHIHVFSAVYELIKEIYKCIYSHFIFYVIPRHLNVTFEILSPGPVGHLLETEYILALGINTMPAQMPWLLKSPEHQHAWYWQYRIGNMQGCSIVNLVFFCWIQFKKWYEIGTHLW